MTANDSTRPPKFNLIDVFSGVGGFTLGFSHYVKSSRWAFDARLMVDVDENARAVAARNIPRTPFIARDVSRLGGNEIRRAARLRDDEAVHVLVGGPPCQGFSRLGRGVLEDPRNALALEYLRLVKELRPWVAVMENVPMVITAHGGVVMTSIVASMKALGYNCVFENLLASDFGVPQHRRRAILIAYHSDLGLLPTLPHRTHERFGHAVSLMDGKNRTRFEPDKLPYVSVEDAIGDLPSLLAGAGEEVSVYDIPANTEYQKWARSGSLALLNHRSRAHSDEYLSKLSVIAEGGSNQALPANQRFSETYFSQAYARLHRNGIAQTITTHFANPGSGRFLHYRDLRSITVREAARLQSFQDSYVFDGTLVTQMRHVGNAVPPLMAAALAEVIGRDLTDAEVGLQQSGRSQAVELGVTAPARRSRAKSTVPSKDTTHQLSLRKALTAKGIRGYRLHIRALPGAPDIAFLRHQVAIFVDGCYWHGCETCHHAPDANGSYWRLKVERIRQRDAQIELELRALGWRVVRVREHEITNQLSRVVGLIDKVLNHGRLAESASTGSAGGRGARR